MGCETYRRGAVILVPGNGVIDHRGTGDIDIAIFIQITGDHGPRPCCRSGNHMLGKPGYRGSVVLVPGNLIVEDRGGKDISIAVAIHIDGKARPGTIRCGGDNMGCKCGGGSAVVFIPGNRIVLVTRGKHIEMCVPVDIGHIDMASTARA